MSAELDASPGPGRPIAPEDLALLERLARRVVELRMETPAVLTIESARPLSLLASQAMIFFEPFVRMLFRFDDYRRLAQLIERREALEELTRLIELAADERERGPRVAQPGDGGGARQAPPGPPTPPAGKRA